MIIVLAMSVCPVVAGAKLTKKYENMPFFFVEPIFLTNFAARKLLYRRNCIFETKINKTM